MEGRALLLEFLHSRSSSFSCCSSKDQEVSFGINLFHSGLQKLHYQLKEPLYPNTIHTLCPYPEPNTNTDPTPFYHVKKQFEKKHPYQFERQIHKWFTFNPLKLTQHPCHFENQHFTQILMRK
jgi:hypothetical protein